MLSSKKMKSVLALVLSLAMIFSLAPINAFALSEGKFEYTVENGQATITSYTDETSKGHLTVPDTLGGYPVVAIEYDAFNYASFESISIPESVTKIDNSCFPESVKSIEVAPGNSKYMSEDGILFSKDKTVLVRYPSARAVLNYAVPDGVKVIAYGSFKFAKISNEIRRILYQQLPYSGMVSDLCL